MIIYGYFNYFQPLYNHFKLYGLMHTPVYILRLHFASLLEHLQLATGYLTYHYLPLS
uniref:Uncharacterized protein n=1 Tax=Anguilla anguilla TaxID=7936 RepID=A0A0E9PGN1_ANGAN